jgi:hypothetical protein
MGFWPGHPYIRQERRRGWFDGERDERDRVLRLIDNRVRVIRHAQSSDRRLLENGEGEAEKIARRMKGREAQLELLIGLRRSVQHGHQR